MDKQLQYIQAIRDIYPDFKIDMVQLNQDGQFNDILLVNYETIFRFPKTLREADKLMRETVLLRTLQTHATLPIPHPLYQIQETPSLRQPLMSYPPLPVQPSFPD